jgi:hypothetical protein
LVVVVTSVILATWEAEIRRIEVRGQWWEWGDVSETPISTNKNLGVVGAPVIPAILEA